jgi:subtilase family serine protease
MRLSLTIAAAALVMSSIASATPRTATVALPSPPHWATPSADLGRLADAPVSHLTISLARSAAQQRAFDALRAAQDNPSSPAYHQWLTPAAIGARFGASDADIAAVTSWLTSQGLTVLRVSSSRTFIEVSGTIRTAEAAFGVELHRYRTGTTTRRAPDRAPAIPAALAHIVTRVTGLTELTPNAPHHRIDRIGPDGVDSGSNNYLNVSDFATIYDVMPAYTAGVTGTGQTVGIIGRSRVAAADITNYGTIENAKLAAYTEVIPPTGVDPGSACADTMCNSDASIDDQFEATLDVTRVTSLATGATVQLIVSGTSNGDDGVDVALEYAIDSFGSGATANIITISFDQCEPDEGSSGTMGIDMLFQQAAMQGQTVFAASGDAGAAGCDPAFTTPPSSQSLAVSSLCVSSAETCVGGTEFADFASPSTYWAASGSALSYIPEGVWNEPLGDPALGSGSEVAIGGGGGISTVIALPTYQTGLGPSGNTFRLVPDVSLTASCHDYYLICFAAVSAGCTGTTDFTRTCGTSAATPDMAAIMALAFSRAGGMHGAANPGLYALASTPGNGVFHDVTVASSGVTGCTVDTPSLCNNSDPGPTTVTGGLSGYLAGSGYDMATGLGSVDVAKLVAAWGTSLTLTPSSLTIADGASGTTNAVVTGITSPTFTCSGLPAHAGCAFAGSGSSGTLTITTESGSTARTAGALGAFLLWLLAGGVLVLTARWRRAAWRMRGVALGLAVAAAVVSCGGGGNSTKDAAVDAAEAPTGTYAVTVTATGGAAQASATLMLTITN